MHLPKSTFLAGLISLCSSFACDPASQSLGDEPSATESGSDSSSGGDLTSVETERIGQLEGGSIHLISVRDDGSVVAAGSSGYGGVSGDGVIFESHWIGAFDTNATLLWSQELPFEVNEFGESVERGLSGLDAASDGAVFVSFIDYSDFDESDNQVSKYAADGTPLWETILPSRPSTVAATADGGALVAGVAISERPDTVDAWAVRLDSLGDVVASRIWENPDGRNTGFDAAIVGDDGLLLGGRWGTDPASSRAQAWLVRVDDDLQPLSEILLPPSGGTDGIRSLRIDEAGEVIASANLGNQSIVTFSTIGEVLSTEATSEDYALWSPFGPNAYLGSERSNCYDEPGGDPCGPATYYGFEDGAIAWEATFDCHTGVGFAVDAQESIVSLSCDVEGGITAELHRIVVVD